jgi:hypothetical protein
MFLMLSMQSPLRLPQRISALFDQPLLFGIHPHPPYPPGYSLLFARCGAKIPIARLGRQLVDGIWAPVGWRIAVLSNR